MRIEILREDSDPLIQELWDALYPLNKTGKIMIYMSYDLGPQGNQRGMVIYLKDLKVAEVVLTKIIKSFNPSFKAQRGEI